MTRILIVDDFFISRQVVANVMQAKNIIDVEVARNGRDGLAMIQSAQNAGTPYDIVFIDRNMPEMDGVEMVKRARAKPEHDPISFIMISAESKQAEILEAIKAGVESYLIKPVTIEIVSAKFEEVIAARKQRSVAALQVKKEEESRREAERRKYNLPPEKS